MASRATPDRDGVVFLVLFVPPAIPPAVQETTRRLNALRDAGASEATVEAAAVAFRHAWRYGATGEGWDEYAAARSAAVAAGVGEELLEAAEPAEAASDAWSWVRLDMAYDPIPALERVTVPVLALFGGADGNMVPEENLRPMRDAFARAGNRMWSWWSCRGPTTASAWRRPVRRCRRTGRSESATAAGRGSSAGSPNGSVSGGGRGAAAGRMRPEGSAPAGDRDPDDRRT